MLRLVRAGDFGETPRLPRLQPAPRHETLGPTNRRVDPSAERDYTQDAGRQVTPSVRVMRMHACRSWFSNYDDRLECISIGVHMKMLEA